MLTEDSLRSGMPRLSTGPGKVPHKWSGASLTEMNEGGGGGGPGRGPLQADVRGSGAERARRE